MKEEDKRTAELFNALSNHVRYKIILDLEDGELCVTDLAHRLGKRQSVISQHLSILKNWIL